MTENEFRAKLRLVCKETVDAIELERATHPGSYGWAHSQRGVVEELGQSLLHAFKKGGVNSVVEKGNEILGSGEFRAKPIKAKIFRDLWRKLKHSIKEFGEDLPDLAEPEMER